MSHPYAHEAGQMPAPHYPLDEIFCRTEDLVARTMHRQIADLNPLLDSPVDNDRLCRDIAQRAAFEFADGQDVLEDAEDFMTGLRCADALATVALWSGAVRFDAGAEMPASMGHDEYVEFMERVDAYGAHSKIASQLVDQCNVLLRAIDRATALTSLGLYAGLYMANMGMRIQDQEHDDGADAEHWTSEAVFIRLRKQMVAEGFGIVRSEDEIIAAMEQDFITDTYGKSE